MGRGDNNIIIRIIIVIYAVRISGPWGWRWRWQVLQEVVPAVEMVKEF